MYTLPAYVPITFGITVLVTLFLCLKTLERAPIRTLVGGLLSIWILLQTLLTLNGFYQPMAENPPRFALLIAPPVLLIVLFALKKSRNYSTTASLHWLTLIHVVRLPVELVLWWLFIHEQVPVEMTFEGRNWDILAGISAPLVAYFGIKRGKMNHQWLLLWNLLCLGLLLNIIATAILSAPLPIQQFGFSQPNVAITHFPFVFLPSVVVPVVLWSHLTAIVKLTSVRKAVSSPLSV